MTMCLSVSLDRQPCQGKLTDMALDNLAQRIEAHDPALGLRAVGVLHQLAEQVPWRRWTARPCGPSALTSENSSPILARPPVSTHR